MGRPPDKAVTRAKLVTVRATDAELEDWKALAFWRKLPLTNLIRLLLKQDRKRLAAEGHRVPKKLPERE